MSEAEGDARSTVRVGAVDIGSNTVRLQVADVTRHPDGTVTHKQVARESQITRLGEQVDARGILLPQAIARTRNALTAFRQRARELGAVFVLATATSAVRDADNGEAFLGEVEYTYGFRTLLLSGEEEAQLAYAGVTSDPELAAAAATGSGLLVDVGGGSTEVVLAEHGRVHDFHSFQLGSVRVSERFLDAHDPPASAALAQAREHCAQLLAQRFPRAREDEPPVPTIGVAGTATTAVTLELAMRDYDPQRVHRARVTVDAVEQQVRRLAAMPLSQRRSVDGLEPERAAVIVGGLVVLVAVLRHFDASELTVSERDILDGVALRAGAIALQEQIAELPEPFGRTSC